MNNFKMQQFADARCLRKRGALNDFNFRNPFKVEHYDVKGRIVGIYDVLNDVVNVGKNKILDVMFNDSTPVANNSWFLGFISLASFSALNAADTMSSHAGWIEFTTYSQSTRVAWGSIAASSQTVTNTTPATFDITSAGTVKGIFTTSNSSKSGTSGTLWATALFASDVPVSNGDQLKITYSVSC
jgi:hypothetical protein